MKRQESIRALVTNLCLLLIIALVYIAAFGPQNLPNAAYRPVLKGRTGADNVALQIAVNQSSDIHAYMETLEKLDARGTFFFCGQCVMDSGVVQEVRRRGHGFGYYTCAEHKGEETDLYIGGGFSVPVMSYEDSKGMRQVCPSINLTKLKESDNWTDILRRRISGDMFLLVAADNDHAEFKKVVQIVLDKGYTILKVDEML